MQVRTLPAPKQEPVMLPLPSGYTKSESLFENQEYHIMQIKEKRHYVALWTGLSNMMSHNCL